MHWLIERHLQAITTLKRRGIPAGIQLTNMAFDQQPANMGL
jgi:hypothetical protein